MDRSCQNKKQAKNKQTKKWQYAGIVEFIWCVYVWSLLSTRLLDAKSVVIGKSWSCHSASGQDEIELCGPLGGNAVHLILFRYTPE